MSAAASVRPLGADDDVTALTELIHRAYARHLASGLRYWGTYQTVDDTTKRFASGRGFVAEVEGAIVGTVTVRSPIPNAQVPIYRDPCTWTITQFAVDPSHRGQGVGALLHEHAARYAASSGATHMALDTAAPATAVIAMYERWGYRVCGECDWRPLTNYLSVVMIRDLCAADSSLAADVHPAAPDKLLKSSIQS